MNVIAWDKDTDLAVSPERTPIVGEWSYNKSSKTKREYRGEARVISLDEQLSKAKSLGIVKIKSEAAVRISSFDWKKERAEEQPVIHSLQSVLDDRQAIRLASDQAEIDVSALTTIEEVNTFEW